MIVIDECHRSIYGLWRQVLEYFDAFLIGLTATPGQADVRLLQPEPRHGVRPRAGGRRRRQRRLRGLPHPHRDHRAAARTVEAGLLRRPAATAQTRARALGEARRGPRPTTPSQLDRDVVAEDQIRTVIRTFRDRLFTEIFPGRTEVPKTLIFAKDDTHAEDIVRIVREEFGKGNDFCQKITYQVDRQEARGPDRRVPQQLQPAHRRHRRHDRHRHRHQAAGVRDVHAHGQVAANYFEQMKGRGVRVINPTDLQAVTPDASAQGRTS